MSQQNPTDLLNEPDLTGQELGDYTVLHRLGRGGMADVYLAEQKSLRRKVAFKVLHQSLAEDPSYVERFKNEAQAAAALTHPNIVRIYEVGTLNSFHYISQEFVDGQNLKQYLVQNRAVSCFMVATTLRQVAAALHKAKEQGVIHRDIKPENILVSDGEVKVADFGLARIRNRKKKGQQDLTKVGMTMGTPLYMSPEQAEGGMVDHRSDIYSLGVTAYHMLAGRPPFEKDNAVATAIAHKTEQPTPLSQIRSDVPRELTEIIDRMMAKEPGDRYEDCGGIIKDLLTVSLDEAEEEWSTHFKTLSPAEARALYSSHLEATRKLDAAIGGRERKRKTLRGVGLVAALTLVAFGIGTLMASLSPPPPLIPKAADESSPIPRQRNIFEQLVYAEQMPNSNYDLKVAAFEAVKHYFPAEGENVNTKMSKHLWADYQIGQMHLQYNFLELAEKIFQQLAGLDAGNFRTLSLHGKAGMVLVFDKMKQQDQSNEGELNRQIDSYRADLVIGMEAFALDLQSRLKKIFGGVTEKNESESKNDRESN